MKQNKLIFLLFMLLCCLGAHSQTCPDFTNLNGMHVKAFYGDFSNPFANEGVISTPNPSDVSVGRHTLITTQGSDPNTGGALQFLPDTTVKQVIRLGNSSVGAQAEALRYTFTVDKNNAILLLKFAVVLEDPGHNFVDQPRFVVRVTDSIGNLTEECAEYDVTAGAGIPGFNTYQPSVSISPVRWRGWTNLGLSLLKFAGQKVRVEVITYDCRLTAHFGYAYFTASCVPDFFKFNCNAGFTVSAPDGFESYLWHDGDTARTITRQGMPEGSSIWCRVTSATGCQFMLTGTVTGEAPVTTPIMATICEGETYTDNYFNLPPQTPGEHTYYHTLVNPGDCEPQVIELKLTVIKRYNHIRVAICEGEDYIGNGFTILQPPIGVRRDTLWTGTTATTPNCDTYNVLELTVSRNISMASIQGDASPCSGELVTYSFPTDGLTHFEWRLPPNVGVAKGNKYTSQITLYFMDATSQTIEFYGGNGCDSSSKFMQVNPKPTYNDIYSATICQGEVFNQYGFNLGVQNNAGYFVYGKDLTTWQGCDSSVTLTLQVLPTPTVRIEPLDAAVCNVGDPITLFAIMSDSVVNIPESSEVPMLFFHNNCNLSFLWSTGATTNSITPNPTQNTLYTVTVTDTTGDCSATASQWVIVNNGSVAVYDTICFGETYTRYGLNLPPQKTPGTNMHPTSINRNGCNISINVYLTVHPPFTHQVIDTVCAGGWVIKDGFEIELFQVGIFRDTLYFISHTGCDSLVTFEITVHPAGELWLRDTVCQGHPYNENGFSLPVQDITGVFTHTRTVKTVNKCDSIITLRLTVYPEGTYMISDEMFAGEAYKKYGFDFPVVTQDTIATQNLKNSARCDSTVILNLKVNEIPEICWRDTIIISGTVENADNFTAQIISGTGTLIPNSPVQGPDYLFKYIPASGDTLNGQTVKIQIHISSDDPLCGDDIFIRFKLRSSPQPPAYIKNCVGGEGKITVTPPPTGGDYEYSIDGVNYQQGNVFSNLTDGTYILSIRDSNGCEGSVSVEILCTCLSPPKISLKKISVH